MFVHINGIEMWFIGNLCKEKASLLIVRCFESITFFFLQALKVMLLDFGRDQLQRGFTLPTPYNFHQLSSSEFLRVKNTHFTHRHLRIHHNSRNPSASLPERQCGVYLPTQFVDQYMSSCPLGSRCVHPSSMFPLKKEEKKTLYPIREQRFNTGIV